MRDTISRRLWINHDFDLSVFGLSATHLYNKTQVIWSNTTKSSVLRGRHLNSIWPFAWRPPASELQSSPRNSNRFYQEPGTIWKRIISCLHSPEGPEQFETLQNAKEILAKNILIRIKRGPLCPAGWKNEIYSRPAKLKRRDFRTHYKPKQHRELSPSPQYRSLSLNPNMDNPNSRIIPAKNHIPISLALIRPLNLIFTWLERILLCTYFCN